MISYNQQFLKEQEQSLPLVLSWIKESSGTSKAVGDILLDFSSGNYRLIYLIPHLVGGEGRTGQVTPLECRAGI